jgi:hypothetical protein
METEQNNNDYSNKSVRLEFNVIETCVLFGPACLRHLVDSGMSARLDPIVAACRGLYRNYDCQFREKLQPHPLKEQTCWWLTASSLTVVTQHLNGTRAVLWPVAQEGYGGRLFAVRIVSGSGSTGYGLDDQAGGSSSPGRVKNVHFSISSRPALGSTQPPTKWVPGALSRG